MRVIVSFKCNCKLYLYMIIKSIFAIVMEMILHVYVVHRIKLK